LFEQQRHSLGASIDRQPVCVRNMGSHVGHLGFCGIHGSRRR
jgi:hypothetical protein